MEEKRKRILKILGIVLGVLASLGLMALAAYALWEKPPEMASPVATEPVVPSPSQAPTASPEPRVLDTGTPTPEPTPTEEPLPEGEEILTDREDGVYTILLVGNDNGNGNTDTIVLGRIDTKQHRMDFVSIPRDTLINSPWRVRRINTVYWGTKHGGGDGLGALKWQVSRLTGFQPDCVAVIDLQVFMDAVDLIGGVWFDVPMQMDYEDYCQDLFIHLQPGYQLLDGYQAMCLCRFRSGYVTGDLGRIEMQQQFLSACADQFLSLGSVPKARELITLLSENMDTDLSAANMAFLLRQYLACKPEDIHFHIPTCNTATFGGCSYALLEVNSWLALINDYLSPYSNPIRWGNVDIVYLKGSGVGCTKSLQDPDYYKPAPSPSPTAEPGEGEVIIEPDPTPTEAPEPTEEPAPTEAPPPTEEPAPTEAPGSDEGPTIIVVQP